MANEDRHGDLRTASLLILAAVALVAGLYVGKEFLVPIVLALVLNVMFRPVVRWMERVRIPTALGAGIIVLTLIAAMVAAAYALTTPVKNWITSAPQTFTTAEQKLARIRQPVQKIVDVADKAEGLVNGPSSAPSTNRSSTTGPSSQPVDGDGFNQPAPTAPQIPPPGQQPLSMLHRVLGATTQVVGGLVGVLLMLYLLLASGSMFLDKFICVLRRRDNKQDANDAVHEAERAILRYVYVTALINLGQGTVVGLVMWWIGVPSPLLWAIATLVVEFVPYLGAAVMVIMLAITSLATFDSVGHILAAPAAYLLITTIQNNIVSPLAYGSGLKLNPPAVLIGVLFWWYVWGIPGAFMAVPLLAVMKIACDKSDRFKPIAELLGE